MLKNKWFFLVFLSFLFLFGVLYSTPVYAQYSNTVVERLYGNNRYETSIAISKAGFTQASTVIIASGLDFPDALAASSLSKLKDAPILLTKKEALDPITITEIKRLKATQALLIGGTGIISTDIENQLKELKISFTRIGGTDRYDTSKKVAEITGVKNGIIIAGDSDFPDALSIAPIASMKAMPILLSPKDALNPNIGAFIKDKNIPVSYLVGGTGVLNESIAGTVPNSKRLSGVDRYSTNLSINTEFAGKLSFDTIYLASGNDFPDALGGSALAAKKNSLIFLTDENKISEATINFIKSKKVKHVVILGGTGAISQDVENVVNDTINSVAAQQAIVSLNKTTDSLTVGGIDNLIATVTPDNLTNKTVKFTSSNNNIVTVDNTGKISGVSAGTATITVTTIDGSKTVSCTVTVTNPLVKVTAVHLNIASDTLNVGETYTIAASITPDNASNKAFTFSSSNKAIATVDNKGKVSGVSAGTATITVTTADGKKTASCIVTVMSTVVKVSAVSLDKTSDIIGVDCTDTLIPTVTPKNATNKYITWTSSDNDVATVDNLGNVKAVSTGSAVIMVTTADGEKTDVCNVTVTEVPPAKSIDPPKVPLIIAIDIGHNAKYDSGAVGIRSEDACTKEVGTLVIQKLTDLGYTVVNCSPKNSTSQTDALKQRCDIANAAHANYYLSIHFNIANGSASGSEIYMGSDKIKSKAQQVLNNLVDLGYTNRGLHDNSRGLYVLKHTNMPAMLVECSFLDSVDDMARYNPEDIADALVNGIISGN